MSREPFEAMPDVMDVKQLAEALQISKAGAYNRAARISQPCGSAGANW